MTCPLPGLPLIWGLLYCVFSLVTPFYCFFYQIPSPICVHISSFFFFFFFFLFKKLQLCEPTECTVGPVNGLNKLDPSNYMSTNFIAVCFNEQNLLNILIFDKPLATISMAT